MRRIATDRRRFIGRVIGAACAIHPLAAAADTRPHMTIGLLPNVSARVLLTQYASLAQYLDRALPASFELVTAPDMGAFQRRTLAGDYDVVVTGAHLGRQAELDAGWKPIAIFEPDIKALLVVRKNATATGAADFRGAQVTFANPMSLVALRGREWLIAGGLHPGRDVTLVAVRRDDSIANVLQRNEAAAAILSGGEFRAIPESQRSDLRILTVIAEVPGFVVLANPNRSRIQPTAIGDALLRFADSADESAQFSSRTGFTKIRSVQPGELRALDPLMGELRRLLAAA